jgi:hypothetical protein
LKCWKTLKPQTLQRSHEIKASVNATKVEKSFVDGTWLNPKYRENGQSATKLRIGEGSTIIRKE